MPDPAAVTLTGPAADKLREVMAAQTAFPDDAGLRVGILNGGCSGFQYHLSLDVAAADDRVFAQDELRILVDRESLRYVEGSQITFVDEGDRTGFIVDNPRAVARCGCGSSFVLRDEA
jgi:iron-sulfur cluster assembly protein